MKPKKQKVEFELSLCPKCNTMKNIKLGSLYCSNCENPENFDSGDTCVYEKEKNEDDSEKYIDEPEIKIPIWKISKAFGNDANDSFSDEETITSKTFPQNKLQEEIYQFWKVRGWDEIQAVLGNLDVTFHQPPKYVSLGLSYNYLEQFYKQAIKKSREKTIDKNINICNQIIDNELKEFPDEKVSDETKSTLKVIKFIINKKLQDLKNGK